MNNMEFVNIAKKIASANTIYMNGTFGQVATTSLMNDCAKRIPSFYTNVRKNIIAPKLDKGYYAFDCVGLIKGIIWGWPNITYASNGLADLNDSGLIRICSDVSTNFSNIQAGEVVWMDGHVGIYAGDKQVIECTTKWTNDVLISNLANLGNDTGNCRTWIKHGKLPMIEYLQGIRYRGHVQDIGWLDWVNEDQICGTIGQGKRLEAIQINPGGHNISVKAHIQDKGWIDYGIINMDTVIGSVGESKRIEAIEINGAVIKCHIQDIGWVDNYSTLQGTMGLSYRLEAVKIKL